MDTLEKQYVTVSWKRNKVLIEEKQQDIHRARILKDILFHNNKNLQNVWIETHTLVRHKSRTYIVDYRETWVHPKLNKQEKIEVNPNLNGGSCPFHKERYRCQSGRGGLELIYGICDSCISEG
jgi:hypothetical protein